MDHRPGSLSSFSKFSFLRRYKRHKQHFFTMMIRIFSIAYSLFSCFYIGVAFAPQSSNRETMQGRSRNSFTYRKALARSEASEETNRVIVQREYETFYWKYQRDPTRECKNYRINYRVEGPEQGQPVLLIHGFGGNVNHFRYNIPLLVREGYRVYAVDLLGFGASDKPKDEDFSIELFVQLVCDFILEQKKTNETWSVCGNSIGGLVSLGVAAEMKEVVQSVVLFNCAGGMSGFRYEDVPWILRPAMYFMQKVVLGPNNGPRFFRDFKTRENVEKILKDSGVYRDTSSVDEELMEIILGPSEDEGAEEVFLRVFAGPAGPAPEYFLPEVNAPILALWGDQDPWVPAKSGRQPCGAMFGEYAKDYTLDLIPGAGHCPHDERPEYCHKSMIPFLAAARERYSPIVKANS